MSPFGPALFLAMLFGFAGFSAALFAWALARTPARRRVALALAIANALLAFVASVLPLFAPRG